MIPVSEFNAALSCVLAAVGKDPKRAELMTVLLEFLPEDVLRFVATDGHRLTYVECQVQHMQPAGVSFILFAEYARKLVKTFPAKSSARLSVVPCGDQIIFTDGETAETFNRLEGDPQYPDYRRVLAHAPEPPRSVKINADFVAEALAAFKPFCVSGGLEIELHQGGPNWFTPVISPDLESITEAVTVIMGFRA